MNLAISNIAWPADQVEAVAELLQRLDVTAIEIAPGKCWPNPAAATAAQVDAVKKKWAAHGITIVAAQGLLFGHPELTIFADSWTRAKTLDYLQSVIPTCARLGAKALVFGSPKNRLIGPRTAETVKKEAVDFFGELAECADDAGTVIALEANPPRYGADYITTAAEAAALVRAVDHTGFRLQLDTACMTMADDPIARDIGDNIALVQHFHISEPDLAPLGTGGVDHAAFAAALKGNGYAGTVSIEMRQVEPFDLQHLEASIGVARGYYFS